MGSSTKKFEVPKCDRKRVDRAIRRTCSGLVVASFLFAWLLSLWSWWSIIGAIWVGVGICFGIMLLNICLEWKLKFPKEQELDAAEPSPNRFTLEFVSGEVAKTWPTGSSVLVRRISDGVVRYEADMWLRPDWVDGLQRQGVEIQFALLPDATVPDSAVASKMEIVQSVGMFSS